MAEMTGYGADSLRKQLRSRLGLARRAGQGRSPEAMDLESQLRAVNEQRNATLRSQAAEDQQARLRAADDGKGGAYKPPDILDPNYIAAVRQYSDQVSKPRMAGPSPVELAAPFKNAALAKRLGVNAQDLSEMQTLRDLPSPQIGEMNRRDDARADLAKRVAAIQAERPAIEAADRAANQVIDLAPPGSSKDNPEGVVADAAAVRQSVRQALLSRLRPPTPPAVEASDLTPPIAPGTDEKAFAGYQDRLKREMAPILDRRRGVESEEQRAAIARGEQQRVAEGAAPPVDPVVKADEDAKRLVAGLSSVGYDPESAMERIDKFASDMASTLPNYDAIAQNLEGFLNSIPPDIRPQVVTRLETAMQTKGSRGRSLAGRVFDATTGGAGSGLTSRGQSMIDAILRKHKGG